MLVLSRRIGERIWIGDNICITICDIQLGKVRIGIECPRDIPVFRQELLDAKAAQQKASRASQADDSSQAQG